ncbi:acyltransferase family protein [Bacillus songklensis]|uniref:Acyltransferase family protein n=1 Tax=Bacillus songklensis TaxID=1069116 RepID=A0ABV8B3H8_9BACI
MKDRRYLNYLNIYRGVCVFFIVIIHTFGAALTIVPQNSHSFYFYLFINRFSRFAVLAFIFLSAFVLFYNYYGRKMEISDWVLFYKKRLKYIIIPYIV